MTLEDLFTTTEKSSDVCQATLEVRDESTEAGMTISPVQTPQIMTDSEHQLIQSSGLDVTVQAPTDQLESSQIQDNHIAPQMTSDNGNGGHMSSDAPCSAVELNSEMSVSRETQEAPSTEDGEIGDGENKPDAFLRECTADSSKQINDDFPMVDTADAQESLVNPTGLTNGGGDDNSYVKTTHNDGLGISTSNFSSEMLDVEAPQNGLSTLACKFPGKHEDCQVNSSEDSLADGNDRLLQKNDDVETSSSRMEDTATLNNIREYKKEQGRSMSASRYTRSARGTTSLTNKVSDMDLEYYMVDALDYACLVGKEVVREVGDYDKQSGSSSSERIFTESSQQRDGLDRVNGRHDDPSEGEEVPTAESPSVKTSAEGDDPVLSSDGTGMGQQQYVQDMNASQATEAAQETEVNPFQGMQTVLDLNQDVADDDQVEACIEYAPVEVQLDNDQVSVNPVASSLAADCVFHSGLLQSEGRHRWKESAASGTFWSPSPSRSSDADNAPSLVWPKRPRMQPRHRPQPIIDLNGDADAAEDDVAEMAAEDQGPILPSLCNGEYSAELTSPRTDVPEFDLNQTVEVVNDAPRWRLTDKQEFHHALSPASLSSPLKPFPAGLNLNEPASPEDSFGQNLLGESAAYKASVDGAISDDADVLITGTRVTNMLPSPSLLSSLFQNSGQHFNSAADFPYLHSSIYGYNPLPAAPGGAFFPAMYGQSSLLPLVDSRGTPAVAPYMMSPVPIVPPPYPQPPFFMNMMGYLPSSIGGVPPDTSLNLNSGLFVNGLVPDSGAHQQVLAPEVGSPLEGTSLSLGKRSEPDGGFGDYSAGCSSYGFQL